jgi:pterin-4a-carbinolamine dehydratase
MDKKDSWEEVSNKLIRTYYFKEDNNISSFVNKVIDIASKQNHHPEITIRKDSVKLSITDNELGKVSDKCHKFALSVDKIR